jgi:hypothetical protein
MTRVGGACKDGTVPQSRRRSSDCPAAAIVADDQPMFRMALEDRGIEHIFPVF